MRKEQRRDCKSRWINLAFLISLNYPNKPDRTSVRILFAKRFLQLFYPFSLLNLQQKIWFIELIALKMSNQEINLKSPDFSFHRKPNCPQIFAYIWLSKVLALNWVLFSAHTQPDMTIHRLLFSLCWTSEQEILQKFWPFEWWLKVEFELQKV